MKIRKHFNKALQLKRWYPRSIDSPENIEGNVKAKT